MINRIEIKDLDNWPSEANHQLRDLLSERIPEGATVTTHLPSHIVITIDAAWPSLRRQNLKHGIVKSLDKVEREHGLTAKVESVEEVDTSDLGGFE